MVAYLFRVDAQQVHNFFVVDFHHADFKFIRPVGFALFDHLEKFSKCAAVKARVFVVACAPLIYILLIVLLVLFYFA